MERLAVAGLVSQNLPASLSLAVSRMMTLLPRTGCPLGAMDITGNHCTEIGAILS